MFFFPKISSRAYVEDISCSLPTNPLMRNIAPHTLDKGGQYAYVPSASGTAALQSSAGGGELTGGASSMSSELQAKSQHAIPSVALVVDDDARNLERIPRPRVKERSSRHPRSG